MKNNSQKHTVFLVTFWLQREVPELIEKKSFGTLELQKRKLRLKTK